MNLENLLERGLKRHQPSRVEIQRLLEAAARALADARREINSPDTRFDCAYKVVMQCALAAMKANGFRPETRPGHHMLLVQCLPRTLGIEPARMLALDKLREKRNLIDYEGDEVDPGTMAACIDHAARLLAELDAWLAAHRKDLA